MADKFGAHQRPDSQQSQQQPQRQRSAQQAQRRYAEQGQQRSAQQRQQQYSGYEQRQQSSAGYSQQQRDYGQQQRSAAYQQQQQRAYNQQQQQSAYGQQQRYTYSQQQGGYAQQRQYPASAYNNIASEAGQYSRFQNPVIKPPKKHTARNVLITLLVVLVLVGGFAGFTGFRLYNSAKTVRADASVVMTDINDLRSQLISDDPSQALPTASDIAKRAKNMKAETSGWEWTVASFVPVYGSDISKVRELSEVLDDLAKNAIVPLVDDMSQVSLKNLLSDGAINVELAQKLIYSLENAAPTIESAAKKLDSMGDAKLEQVNGPLNKARSALDSLANVTTYVSGIAPRFADIVGVNGPRTYLIIAQSCAEIRSTGGFIGTVGTLTIDNGRISLGEFRGISELYPRDLEHMYAPISDDELAIFGMHVSYQIADMSYIPDFARVSQMVKFAWEDHGNVHVNGAIGIDPMFLQNMLALTGSTINSNGFTVDGTNAAAVLLRDVYYIEDPDGQHTNEMQDALFKDVAAQSFNLIMSNLGNIQMTDLLQVVKDGFSTRHLQLWMENDDEQNAVEAIGAAGTLPHDPTHPTLGVYFSEESYSKLFWYFKCETTVGDATKNADGSMTYPVTMTYWNMIQPDQVDSIPEYALSHNGAQRSHAEMITWVYLAAPMGGRITDMQTEGDFMPPGSEWRTTGGVPFTGTMTEATLHGLNFWSGLSRTLPGGTFTLHFNVVTSPEATEPLKVIRTPEAQEVAGW